MFKNSTFSAKAYRDELANQMNDISIELKDYTDYILCDAISELAESSVSIYTSDRITYCRENDRSVQEALFEGLALNPREYFNGLAGADYKDYEAHLGAIAWYMDAERAMYDELGRTVEYIVVGALAAEYGDVLSTDAYMAMRPDASDIDTCDTIEEIKDGACTEYADALEELAEDIAA